MLSSLRPHGVSGSVPVAVFSSNLVSEHTSASGKHSRRSCFVLSAV